MATAGQKDPGALMTIGELSQELGVGQHILRYWETRFPQLRPMQRAGNRRYYRSADAELARKINRLLNQEGYTVRGVQKLLRERSIERAVPSEPSAGPAKDESRERFASAGQSHGIDIARLILLRDRLAAALER